MAQVEISLRQIGDVEGSGLPAVVVCPGGGYTHRAFHEGDPVAERLAANGIKAFVLDYSVAPARFPQALEELAEAVATVREHADEWGVDARNIAVMGFSAGAHLAGSLGVMWHEPWLSEAVGRTPEDIRPDAMCLCYPVITSGEFAHRGSFEILTGGDAELTDRLSLENLVDGRTPRAFLWHTAEDGSVPVQNSLLMSSALAAAGVEFSLHIFPYGRHGIGLADGAKAVVPQAQCWPELFAAWLRRE